VEEFDYYNWRKRENEDYDAEEAPYEPLAPDLAGQSPLAEWKGTVARPSGGQQSDESGMRLREANAIGAAPTPTAEQATGEETVTVPSHYLPRSEEEAKDPNSNYNILTDEAKPQQAGSFFGNYVDKYYTSKLRALQQIASGVYEKAADIFGRSRGN